MKQLPGYYAILPPAIRYNRNLTANAKLLWCELSALQSHCNKVYASNEYLGELIGVKERQIRYLLNELKNEKLIAVTKDGTSRIITVKNTNFGLKKRTNTKTTKTIKNEPEWLNEYVATFEDGVEDL